MRKLHMCLFTVMIMGLLVACGQAGAGQTSGDLTTRPIRVVTTIGMIKDIVENIGGDRVQVDGLMGAGVDPHLYKASEGDVSRLAQADLVFYNACDPSVRP